VEVRHDTGSAVPQQIVLQARRMLKTGISTRSQGLDGKAAVDAPDDPGRGGPRSSQADQVQAVSQARLGTWETFKRHCKSCERTLQT